MGYIRSSHGPISKLRLKTVFRPEPISLLSIIETSRGAARRREALCYKIQVLIDFHVMCSLQRIFSSSAPAASLVVYIFGVIYFGSFLLSVSSAKNARDAKGGSSLELGSVVIAVGIALMDVVMDGNVECGGLRVRQ